MTNKKPSDYELDERLFYDYSYEVSDADIQFFRDHPEELGLLDQRTTFRVGRLVFILVVAVCLFAASKVISVNLTDDFDAFANSVLVDILFEMGAAMIGALATLLFLETQDKRQLRENLKLRTKIRERIAALEAASSCD